MFSISCVRDEFDRLQKIVAIDGREQIAVADAVDVDRDLRRVDGDERRALLALPRQHIGFAGEMSLRRPVTDVDLIVGRLQQGLADRRGQALAHHDRIALAVLQALDADLLVLRRDRRVRRARHRHIGREVRLARELLGEIETDTRRARFVVDLIVEDAETVLLAHRLVGLAQGDVVAPVERGLVSVQGAAPRFVPCEQVAKHRQRHGLRFGRGGMLVGGVGGGRALCHEIPAAVRLGFVGSDRDVGVSEPARRVPRGRRDGRGGEFLRGIELARDGGRDSGLAQIVRRLAHDLRPDLGRFDPQRLGQAHRVARRVLARKGFCVRRERGACGHERKEEGKGAQQMQH